MGGDVCGLPADAGRGLTPTVRASRFVGVAVAWLLLDQATKLLVVHLFRVPGHHVTVVPGWLDLTLTSNSGAAFGILNGARWLFVLIGLGALGAVVYFRRQVLALPVLPCYALALVAAGAAGNLVDRVLRGGQVVDFIHFHIARIGFVWPDFNVADIGVTCGMTVYVCYVLWCDLQDSREQSDARPA